MKRLLKGLLIIFSVCVITGCPQPVGKIDSGGNGNGNGNGGKGAELNYLIVLPNRQLYETEERFERDNDLQILVAEDGVVKEIPANDSTIKIEIIENPGLSSESITTVTSMYFPFSLPGRHDVRVTYDNRLTRKYTVEVRGTYTFGGDGSDFMEIIWL